MTAIVSTPATVLQALFGDKVLELARETQFVRRLRELQPVDFVRVFCLTLVSFPKATLQQMAAEIKITASALCQRLQQTSAALFLEQMLCHALSLL